MDVGGRKLEGLVNANAVAKTSLKVLVKNHLKFFDSSFLIRRTEWRFEGDEPLTSHSLTPLCRTPVQDLISGLRSISTHLIPGKLVSNFTF